MSGEKPQVKWKKAGDAHVASVWSDELVVRECASGFVPEISLDRIVLCDQDSPAAAQATAERAHDAIAAMVTAVRRVDTLEYAKASHVYMEPCRLGLHADCPGESDDDFAIPCDCACHARQVIEHVRTKVAELEARTQVPAPDTGAPVESAADVAQLRSRVTELERERDEARRRVAELETVLREASAAILSMHNLADRLMGDTDLDGDPDMENMRDAFELSRRITAALSGPTATGGEG